MSYQFDKKDIFDLAKYMEQPDSNWMRLINSLWTDIDSEVRKVFFVYFAIVLHVIFRCILHLFDTFFHTLNLIFLFPFFSNHFIGIDTLLEQIGSIRNSTK